MIELDDLTVRVEPGRVTGFLGPNGSGKTTTMRRSLTAVPGGVTLTAPAVLRQLLLRVAWAVLVAVLAVALGTLLRAGAGGIGLGSALVFVLPPVLSLAGGRWAEGLVAGAAGAAGGGGPVPGGRPGLGRRAGRGRDLGGGVLGGGGRAARWRDV